MAELPDRRRNLSVRLSAARFRQPVARPGLPTSGGASRDLSDDQIWMSGSDASRLSRLHRHSYPVPTPVPTASPETTPIPLQPRRLWTFVVRHVAPVRRGAASVQPAANASMMTKPSGLWPPAVHVCRR